MLAIYHIIEHGRRNSYLNKHAAQQDIDDLLIAAARASKENGGSLTAAMEKLIELGRRYRSSQTHYLLRLGIQEAEEYNCGFGAEGGADQRVTVDLDRGTMGFEYSGQFKRRNSEGECLLPGSVAEPLKMARMVPTIRLRDLALLGISSTDVYLVHKQGDVRAISASGLWDLTEQGRAEFADLLSAKVEAIRPGTCGVELVITGILLERLVDFERAQAASLQLKPYLGVSQPDGRHRAEPVLVPPKEAVQAIRDHLCFERDTAHIWPWRLPANAMLGDENRLQEIGAALHYDPEGGYDMEELHQALNETFGVNPALEQGQTMVP